MKGWLFAIFIIALVIAVTITEVGLLANWGILIKSEMVEAGKELPLLGTLVTGVLIAFVGLAIELGRRWFIANKVVEEIPTIYLDLVSAAIVLPTSKEEEARSNFTMVTDYFKESYQDRNEEVKLVVIQNLESDVASKMSLRFRGAKSMKPVPEVRTPS